MEKKPVFSSYHPWVSLVYAAFIITVSTALIQPVITLISLICSVLCEIYANGRRTPSKIIKTAVAVFIPVAVINPLFSHGGQTILMYFPSGNPLTLESIIYGIFAGLMFSSVIIWFSFFSSVIDADKIIYLFGKLSPSLSLLLSMTIRFIPMFRERYGEIQDANFALYGKSDTIKSRINLTALCLRTAIQRTAEQGAEMSDSMKSRGFGTGKRRTYSPYEFEKRDKKALLFICCSALFFVCGCVSGCMHFRFYPSLKIDGFGITTVVMYTLYFALCIFPVYAEKKEEKLWKNLQ